MLALGTLAVHDKHVLAAKLVERGQLFRDNQRHNGSPWHVALHYYIYCKGLRGKMQGFCLDAFMHGIYFSCSQIFCNLPY